MKLNSLSVRSVIAGIAAIMLLTAAGCGSNAATTTTTNITYPTSTAPVTTTLPTTTPASVTTVPVTTIPQTTIPVTTTVPATTTPATTPPVTYAYTVNIAVKAAVGNYLVDSRGFALYYTTSDKPNYSNLPDETLTSWPNFYAAGITVGAGLNASDFGTYTRDSGKKQTTYKGYPLYLSILDHAPGDTVGNALGGVWFLVKP